MISKSIEPADYKDLGFGLALFPYVGMRCQAADITIYWPHPHRQWEYSTALTMLHRTFGDKPVSVLDIGCGSSILGPSILLRTHATIHEIDPDERLATARQDMAKRLGRPESRHRFTVGGIESLNTATTYDAVFCMSVIEHIPVDKQEEAWTKLAALVKPGGLLVLTTDFGPDAGKEWVSDSEREVKFDPNTIMEKAELLRSLGFVFDIDPTFHGPEVYDYTFFRIVARKKAGGGL